PSIFSPPGLRTVTAPPASRTASIGELNSLSSKPFVARTPMHLPSSFAMCRSFLKNVDLHGASKTRRATPSLPQPLAAAPQPRSQHHAPPTQNSARVFPDGVRLCQMLDLNQRRHKPADLQSASFGRSDNLAYTIWCAQYPTTRLKDSL